MPTPIGDVLDRMQRWCAPKNNLREKSLEGLLRLDWLIDALSYQPDGAGGQCEVNAPLVVPHGQPECALGRAGYFLAMARKVASPVRAWVTVRL